MHPNHMMFMGRHRNKGQTFCWAVHAVQLHAPPTSWAASISWPHVKTDFSAQLEAHMGIASDTSEAESADVGSDSESSTGESSSSAQPTSVMKRPAGFGALKRPAAAKPLTFRGKPVVEVEWVADSGWWSVTVDDGAGEEGEVVAPEHWPETWEPHDMPRASS